MASKRSHFLFAVQALSVVVLFIALIVATLFALALDERSSRCRPAPGWSPDFQNCPYTYQERKETRGKERQTAGQ